MDEHLIHWSIPKEFSFNKACDNTEAKRGEAVGFNVDVAIEFLKTNYFPEGVVLEGLREWIREGQKRLYLISCPRCVQLLLEKYKSVKDTLPEELKACREEMEDLIRIFEEKEEEIS